MSGRVLLTVLVLSVAPAADAAEPAAAPSPEENVLRVAGVAGDGDGLLTFFREHTPGADEIKKIEQLVRQLGADDFDDRQHAYEALKKVGARALPLVRPAAHGGDVETARRAERVLKEVDPPPHMPAVAAARLLARRAPAGAVAALLDYLPVADNSAIEDEVRAALLALTADGQADAALAAALDDARPVRRAAAAYVLGRKGDATQREAVRKRLTDADAWVRWQAAAALLAAHDRTAVPALAALLADGPFDTAWRAEGLLRRLADDQGPAATLDDEPATRRKCRDAWAAWWADKGAGVDVGRYTEPARPLGYTLGVEYNTGRVWECDIDGSLRWEIRDLEGPMDAQVLPSGRVLIAEADAHRVTERDLKGKVLWEKKIEGEPNGCQRLANGNTFVSTCDRPRGSSGLSRALEFGPDGRTILDIKLSQGAGAFNAIRRGRTGDFYYVCEDEILKSDSPDKILDRFHLPRGEKNSYVDLEILPGGRFMVADSWKGRVMEVAAGDINAWLASYPEENKRRAFLKEKGGDLLWTADVPGACGVMRMANGHTLVGARHKVIELNADGKPVWVQETEGYVRRVYRR